MNEDIILYYSPVFFVFFLIIFRFFSNYFGDDLKLDSTKFLVDDLSKIDYLFYISNSLNMLFHFLCIRRKNMIFPVLLTILATSSTIYHWKETIKFVTFPEKYILERKDLWESKKYHNEVSKIETTFKCCGMSSEIKTLHCKNGIFSNISCSRMIAMHKLYKIRAKTCRDIVYSYIYIAEIITVWITYIKDNYNDSNIDNSYV